MYFEKKQLEDVLENKKSKKPTLTKNRNRNRYASNYNKKNKSKRTHKILVENGIAYSMNACVATCFYCMKKGHTSKSAISNILVFQMGNILGCLLLSNYFSLNPRIQTTCWGPKEIASLFCR